MRLRIFPRDESFFDLFEAAADNMAESARLLEDLLQDFVDPELKSQTAGRARTRRRPHHPRHLDPAQLNLHRPI
jgi:hypothetical protein